MQLLKNLLLTSIFSLFATFTHAAEVNMAPIISYLLSDTQQVSLAGKTKYFATSLGATGSRTYAEDGTYTASILLANGTVLDTNGTYDIAGNVVTLNRENPAAATLVLTYLGEESGGSAFEVTINGGEPFQSISFDTEAEREIYVAEFLSSLIVGETKYFATSLGATGSRTYAEDGTYTASITLYNGTVLDTNGTYDIVDYVMILDRESPAAATLVLTYLGEESGGLAFSVTINDGEPFQSVSFATEAERDAYVLSVSIVGETKYFANSLGATGFRTYGEDGTFTGSVTLANGTTFDTNGTYNIEGTVLTINRTSPAASTLVLTYLGMESGGLAFDITVNGGESFQTISFATETERDTYVLSTLIVGQTKYFATSLGAKGSRTYAEDGTYTASITLASGTVLDTNGTYAIVGNVVNIDRESPGEATLELTYLGQESGGSAFDVTVNGGEPFQSLSFSTEAERDAAFLTVLITGQTKYFANSLGAIGFRNYSKDGTYTGSITQSDGITTYDVNGTYGIVGDVLTLNRENPGATTLVLTYLGMESGGLAFDITVNGGEPFQTISFATEAERDIFVKSFAIDVMPILEANCESCHPTTGSGNKIFRVGDTAFTYDNIINNTLINTILPDSSLILLKGNAEVSHNGGDVLSDVNSTIVRDWIWQGGFNN